MFTLWTIDGVPQRIYFTNTDHFEQALKNRDIDRDSVKSQELSLEKLVRLKDNEYKVFLLFLK